MSSRRAASALLGRASSWLAQQGSTSTLQQGSRLLAASACSTLPSHRACACTGPCYCLSGRSFWTSAPSLSAGLASILKEELGHEQKSYAKPAEIANGPPAPYTLTEAPGDTMLTLSRSFEGGEKISIDLHVNNQPAPSYDEGDASGGEDLSTVVFNVHVIKGSDALVFECESDGTFVAINHVSHEPAEGGPPSASAYTGPVFDELDENLQKEFRGYLESRGVTPELGEYLRHLVYDKEQREYMAWLKRAQDFVSSK